jgi:hypothetical protein
VVVPGKVPLFAAKLKSCRVATTWLSGHERELNEGPFVMAPDNHGNVYILDEQNNRVREVNTAGIISTIAGGGTGALEDGVAAIAGPPSPEKPGDPSPATGVVMPVP